MTTSISSRPADTAPAPGEGTPYRVLIADDSSAIRMLVKQALQDEPSIEVWASVASAREAIDQTRRSAGEGRAIEVVLLDIEMPVMDGLAALPDLVAVQPPPRVIMVSSSTHSGADATFRALALGASDYVCKPTARDVNAREEFARELTRRVTVWGAKARKDRAPARERPPPPVRLVPRPLLPEPVPSPPVVSTPSPAPIAATPPPPRVAPRPTPAPAFVAPRPAAPVVELPRALAMRPPAAIAIGGSTGAPQVLLRLLADLADCRLGPLFITQHMPPGFTKVLAEQLARAGRRTCIEAADGTPVRENEAYVAPGDFHLVVEEGPAPVLRINKNPPENYCRPAVDPMFRSLATLYRDRLLAVVLTGMGQDGMKGAEAVVAAGGRVIVQDQASSVVWGMPGAVARGGFASCELASDEIGPMLRRIAGGGR